MSLALDIRPAFNYERHIEQPASTSRNRAIVMGGGMAGLAAARVLSDHYGK